MKTTVDILESVRSCPILIGEPKNEIGADCDECAEISPDRRALCDHIEKGGSVRETRALMVYWEG